jgi:hypothetical protein
LKCWKKEKKSISQNDLFLSISRNKRLNLRTMEEYWEALFKNEGALWKFEPSDSAAVALELFKSENTKQLLIPGVGYGRNAGLFHENGLMFIPDKLTPHSGKLTPLTAKRHSEGQPMNNKQ